jgi:hypothetical protein
VSQSGRIYLPNHNKIEREGTVQNICKFTVLQVKKLRPQKSLTRLHFFLVKGTLHYFILILTFWDYVFWGSYCQWSHRQWGVGFFFLGRGIEGLVIPAPHAASHTTTFCTIFPIYYTTPLCCLLAFSLSLVHSYILGQGCIH